MNRVHSRNAAASGSAPFEYDVLGFGCVAVDDLIYLEEYPPPDVKMPVLMEERQPGGLTGTALVAASRLGSRCAYAGVLGDDDLSAFARERLSREGIDLAHLVVRPGTGPAHATILVDSKNNTRTIFYNIDRCIGADDLLPDDSVLGAAKVLLVDHFGINGMLRATRAARARGIPVVADFESDRSPSFGELLPLVDHLVLSQGFAFQLTGASVPQEAARALWSGERSAVVITSGANGCWRLGDTGSNEPVHHPAYKVSVVDTTGCGDVFHGAYASALARGLGLEDRVRFASAASALKATCRGGQAGIPSREAVEEFLAGQEW